VKVAKRVKRGRKIGRGEMVAPISLQEKESSALFAGGIGKAAGAGKRKKKPSYPMRRGKGGGQVGKGQGKRERGVRNVTTCFVRLTRNRPR